MIRCSFAATKIQKRWLLLLTAVAQLLQADPGALSPWSPTTFEIQPRASYLYQNYHRMATSNGSFHRHANDQFATLSAGASVFDWYGAMAMTLASTRHHHFGVDRFNLLARYQFMDDVAAENEFSFIGSAFLNFAPTSALRDMGAFHHGKFEGGFYLSVGKEFSEGSDWVWRGWGGAGLAVADVGSPWFAANLALERKFCHRAIGSLFANGLYGFGGRGIDQHHFRGYGPINHRSIDIGASYTYSDDDWRLTLAYARRVYARNYPDAANLITVSFLYPFGL